MEIVKDRRYRSRLRGRGGGGEEEFSLGCGERVVRIGEILGGQRPEGSETGIGIGRKMQVIVQKQQKYLTMRRVLCIPIGLGNVR